jgi:nitroimidazol reductase NimA-like FMN-containing flavoprotein (pyridoxamine 5'-phosphate oxidase superfamily)
MDLAKTRRTAVRRLPKRGHYDRETVYAILDEGVLCHIGFAADDQPYVIPTSYARVGDDLYIHGSSASRALRAVGAGVPACVTVTLMDGVVLARSAFHHSFNYRSVVILGELEPVSDPGEKAEALRAFVDHVVPGRSDAIRGPTRKELKATAVVRLPLVEASAKVRTGPPVDDEEDYELETWAGVLPLRTIAEPAIGDDRLMPGTEPPPVPARWAAVPEPPAE